MHQSTASINLFDFITAQLTVTQQNQRYREEHAFLHQLQACDIHMVTTAVAHVLGDVCMMSVSKTSGWSTDRCHVAICNACQRIA